MSSKKRNKKVRSVRPNEEDSTSSPREEEQYKEEEDGDSLSRHSSHSQLVEAAEMGLLDVPNLDDDHSVLSGMSSRSIKKRQSISKSASVDIPNIEAFHDSLDNKEAEKPASTKKEKSKKKVTSFSPEGISNRLELLEDLDMIRDHVAWCVGQGLMDEFGTSKGTGFDFDSSAGSALTASITASLNMNASDGDIGNSSDSERSTLSEGKVRKSRTSPRVSIAALAAARRSTVAARASRRLDPNQFTSLKDAINDDEFTSIWKDIDSEKLKLKTSLTKTKRRKKQGRKKRPNKFAESIFPQISRQEIEEQSLSDDDDDDVPDGEKFSSILEEVTQETVAEMKKDKSRKLANSAFARRQQLALEFLKSDDDDKGSRSKKDTPSKDGAYPSMTRPVGFSSYDQEQNLHLLRYKSSLRASMRSLRGTDKRNKRWMWIIAAIVFLCSCAALTATVLVVQNTQKQLLKREVKLDRDLEDIFSWFGHQRHSDKDNLQEVVTYYQGLRRHEDALDANALDVANTSLLDGPNANVSITGDLLP